MSSQYQQTVQEMSEQMSSAMQTMTQFPVGQHYQQAVDHLLASFEVSTLLDQAWDVLGELSPSVSVSVSVCLSLSLSLCLSLSLLLSWPLSRSVRS